MRSFLRLLSSAALVLALSACGTATLVGGAVDAAAGVAGIAVDAVGTTVDIVTSPVR